MTPGTLQSREILLIFAGSKRKRSFLHRNELRDSINWSLITAWQTIVESFGRKLKAEGRRAFYPSGRTTIPSERFLIELLHPLPAPASVARSQASEASPGYALLLDFHPSLPFCVHAHFPRSWKLSRYRLVALVVFFFFPLPSDRSTRYFWSRPIEISSFRVSLHRIIGLPRVTQKLYSPSRWKNYISRRNVKTNLCTSLRAVHVTKPKIKRKRRRVICFPWKHLTILSRGQVLLGKTIHPRCRILKSQWLFSHLRTKKQRVIRRSQRSMNCSRVNLVRQRITHC